MNKKLIIAAILAIVATAAGLRHPAEQHHSTESQETTQQQTGRHASAESSDEAFPRSSSESRDNTVGSGSDITELTKLQRVADYLHQHQRLPSYYLTKSQARRQGWEPSKGNLCQILPGRAIGGDHFSNREKVLPEKQGRRWFEADVNYDCGRRGSDRMLYSSDGMIYVTRDHYRHVEQVY
ncbi:ribonuclease domain-containing protein [Erwinia sp. E_sp_B04_7]|uniref:ribonuclease domain-containing protein n=1 Tax=unclassified Erwinia TaxID=2622719 RepID=UPI0030D08CBB